MGLERSRDHSYQVCHQNRSTDSTFGRQGATAGPRMPQSRPEQGQQTLDYESASGVREPGIESGKESGSMASHSFNKPATTLNPDSVTIVVAPDKYPGKMRNSRKTPKV